MSMNFLIDDSVKANGFPDSSKSPSIRKSINKFLNNEIIVPVENIFDSQQSNIWLWSEYRKTNQRNRTIYHVGIADLHLYLDNITPGTSFHISDHIIDLISKGRTLVIITIHQEPVLSDLNQMLDLVRSQLIANTAVHFVIKSKQNSYEQVRGQREGFNIHYTKFDFRNIISKIYNYTTYIVYNNVRSIPTPLEIQGNNSVYKLGYLPIDQLVEYTNSGNLVKEVSFDEFQTVRAQKTYLEPYIYPIYIDVCTEIPNRISVPEYILNDARSGQCIIVILFPYEGFARKFTQYIDTINKFSNEFDIPKTSLYLAHGDLQPAEFSEHAFSYIPVETIFTWLRDDTTTQISPYNRDNNLFLVYSRRPRLPRSFIPAIFFKHGFESRCLYSISPNFENMINIYPHQHYLKKYNIDSESFLFLVNNSGKAVDNLDLEQIDPVTSINHSHYENTFATIVAETFFEENILFITEKTYKPIVAGHPFIMFSSVGTLQYLRSIGFKTFSEWWSEDYDLITSPQRRFEEIENLLVEISKKSESELIAIRKEMEPVLIHNQNLVLRHIKNTSLAYHNGSCPLWLMRQLAANSYFNDQVTTISDRSIGLPMNPEFLKIQIIATPRSGSTYLFHAMRDQLFPDIEFDDMIENETIYYASEPLSESSAIYQKLRANGYTSTMNNQIHNMATANKVLVKNIIGHLQRLAKAENRSQFDQYKTINFYTIGLLRRNIFDQILSFSIAVQTQEWRDPVTESLIIDENIFRQCVDFIVKEISLILHNEITDNQGNAYKFLYDEIMFYEDFNGNCKEDFESLNLYERISNHLMLHDKSPTIEKNHDKKQIVINYYELWELMKHLVQDISKKLGVFIDEDYNMFIPDSRLKTLKRKQTDYPNWVLKCDT